MSDSTRRVFLRQTAIGLATFGASGLVLSCTQPTQEVKRDPSDHVLIQMGPKPQDEVAAKGEVHKPAPLPGDSFVTMISIDNAGISYRPDRLIS